MQQPAVNWSELAPLIVFMVVMLVLFWVVIIRPAKSRQQKHAQLVQTVEVGDEIVTVGGIYGKVTRVGADDLQVEVAPDVRLTFDRRAIRRRQEKEDA